VFENASVAQMVGKLQMVGREWPQITVSGENCIFLLKIKFCYWYAWVSLYIQLLCGHTEAVERLIEATSAKYLENSIPKYGRIKI